MSDNVTCQPTGSFVSPYCTIIMFSSWHEANLTYGKQPIANGKENVCVLLSLPTLIKPNLTRFQISCDLSVLPECQTDYDRC